jgi:hypothetical protein
MFMLFEMNSSKDKELMTKEGMCSRRKKIAIFVVLASARSVNKDIDFLTNKIIQGKFLFEKLI